MPLFPPSCCLYVSNPERFATKDGSWMEGRCWARENVTKNIYREMVRLLSVPVSMDIFVEVWNGPHCGH